MRTFVCGFAACAFFGPAFAAEPAPFLSFGVQPSEVVAGDSARLSWASLNAESCAASGDWTGTQPSSGRLETQALNAPATYTLTCTGHGGSVERRVFVNVVPGESAPAATTVQAAAVSALEMEQPTPGTVATETAAAPSTATTGTSSEPQQESTPLSLDASPLAVAYNGDTTIAWSSPGSTKCVASGAWSGTKAASGRESIRALHGESRFSLTCMGPRGATTKEVAVTVSAASPVTVNLSAGSKVLAPNHETTLAWTSTGADSCTASGAWLGPRTTMGSESTTPLETSSTFALTCSGAGGTASDSVAITVNAATAAALSYVPAN